MSDDPLAASVADDPAPPACRTPPARTARPGGRAARHAARNAPLAEAMRPIRAGLPGGQYKPLSDAEVLRIHEAALTALAEIGLADAPPSGVEILTGAGAVSVQAPCAARAVAVAAACWPLRHRPPAGDGATPSGGRHPRRWRRAPCQSGGGWRSRTRGSCPQPPPG